MLKFQIALVAQPVCGWLRALCNSTQADRARGPRAGREHRGGHAVSFSSSVAASFISEAR